MVVEVPSCLQVNAFTRYLLEQVVRKHRSLDLSEDRQVFIEKERDLVPLIEMRQLSKVRTNYLMILETQEGEERVIEKPVLLKKKNKPEIGITELMFKEMPEVERLSYPCERGGEMQVRGTRVERVKDENKVNQLGLRKACSDLCN